MNKEDYFDIKCIKCSNWELHPKEEARHHVQHFKLEKWTHPEISILTCLECNHSFQYNWDDEAGYYLCRPHLASMNTQDNYNKYKNMKKRRKHYDEIIAWANGAYIERELIYDYWIIDHNPTFDEKYNYRIHGQTKDKYKEVKEAYEAGETIQFKDKYVGAMYIDYEEFRIPGMVYPKIGDDAYYWRIKPKNYIKKAENMYIPFTWENKTEIMGKWIKWKKDGSLYLVTSIGGIEDFWVVAGNVYISSEELLQNYEFLNGTPCGVKKYT